MKLENLLLYDRGIPFYHVKPGQLYIRIETSYKGPVFKKVDDLGAMDYPYDHETCDLYNIDELEEKRMVKVIKRSHKIYRDYVTYMKIALENLH